MPHDLLLSKIVISRADMQQMRQSDQAMAPEEACGLLPGQIEHGVYRVSSVIPVANELHSPVRYRMDAQAQIDAFIHIDSQNLELVGIYHSHPAGPPYPSPTDIAEAFYPESAYLIWSAMAGDWQCRAFLIRDGKVQKIRISISNLE